MHLPKAKKDVGAKRTLLRRGARFFRCGLRAPPPHSPRREARHRKKAGKRGAGVARAFTSAQPQLAGPFAEKEEQGSGATAAFLRQMHLPKAKKTPEQSGLCSDAARVFPVRHAHPAPSPRAARRGSRKRPESAAQGVARAFTSAQPQLAGPFAEKEEQGSEATGGFFCGRCNLSKAKKTPEQSGLCSDVVEATPGIEPGNEDFADPCLTAWLCRRRWSGRRGSNPPPQPWQGCALPNELLPQIRRPCGGMMVGTPSGARTLDTLIKSQVLYQLS